MSNTILLMHANRRAQEAETEMIDTQPAHAALLHNMEELLATARPRLVRLARLQGVGPDAADDIAQETLLAAWRSLDHLHAPDRFDAWLDGICRNMCRRWARAQGANVMARPWPALLKADESAEALPAFDLPDPQALDPAEELDRQDLEVLLDRALGHLPASAREAMELCYLAELPQREAALRLGLTIGALELRLHRARRQLREVLSGDLRADAEAFGLALDDEPSTGWRESREWCNHCGRQRLRGTFELLADGRINFRLRCPACSPNHDIDMNDSGGWVELGGSRAFRPALKRLQQAIAPRQRQALAGERHFCMECQQPMQSAVIASDAMGMRIASGRYYAVMECPNRHYSISWAGGIAGWGHPAVARFQARHPRWVSEPDVLAEYAGRPAIRFYLTDISSAARLTIFADYPTLRLLAAFEE